MSSAWVASLGSALEDYDLSLCNLASALILAPLFFPSADSSLGLIASFGTYSLGFAIRSVGGVAFGILAYRLGRKFVLMATVLLVASQPAAKSRPLLPAASRRWSGRLSSRR